MWYVGSLCICLALLGTYIYKAGFMVYTELASMCGHKRSGAEVVYLVRSFILLTITLR